MEDETCVHSFPYSRLHWTLLSPELLLSHKLILATTANYCRHFHPTLILLTRSVCLPVCDSTAEYWCPEFSISFLGFFCFHSYLNWSCLPPFTVEIISIWLTWPACQLYHFLFTFLFAITYVYFSIEKDIGLSEESLIAIFSTQLSVLVWESCLG